MLKLSKVKQLEKLKVEKGVKEIAIKYINILNDSYGESRDIEKDLGGYVLFIEKEEDLEEAGLNILWVKDNSDFFATVTYKEYIQIPDGNKMLAAMGIYHDKEVERKKKVINSFRTDVDFSSFNFEVLYTPKYESVGTYSILVYYVVSKKEIAFLIHSSKYIEKNWNEKIRGNSEWRIVKIQLSEEEQMYLTLKREINILEKRILLDIKKSLKLVER